MQHVLVVEDEEHLAVGIKYNLDAEGYRVTTFSDGPQALRYVEEHPQEVDLVILDLMLPGMSGYAVCEALRAAGNGMPILILSARTLTEDRTRGFDVGANQYLTKPFELDELLSRVKNLLNFAAARAERRSDHVAPLGTYSFADAVVDFDSFQVKKDGETIRLTQLQAKLLRYFIENEGRVISRQELLENVWDLPGNLHTRAPDQFLRHLRKLFEPDPARPTHFLTIRDVGYRFVASGDDT